MESSNRLHVLELIEAEFDGLSKNPEIYVQSQPEKADTFKQLSKKVYSAAVRDNKNFKGRSLSELLIDGFDDEQIWQQSDLLNREALLNITQAVRTINLKDIFHAITKTNQIHPAVTYKDNEICTNNDDAFSNEESNAEEEYPFDDDSDSPAEMEVTLKKKLAIKEKKKGSKKSSYGSIVDDQFFKLSKMEEFLRIRDLQEADGDASDSEEENFDLFQDIPSDGIDDLDEESDEEGVKTKKSSGDLMYDDFFDDPESEIDDESHSTMADNDETMMEENEETSQRGDSNVEMKDGIEEDNTFEGDSEKSVDNKNARKTAFELEQEKTRKKIEEYEKSMLQPSAWQLTGEVDASSRPIDSLMYHETDFESNTKKDILIDKAFTERIEEITIMAIRNKAFMDVERKYKSTAEVIAYKKEITLEQTKSKKSLAQVYEEDYLKKLSKQDEEEDPKHKEIKKLMDSLFPELYALFGHIPKPAIPEIKIVNNLPAITVEEVAPTSVSDMTLLAPEEVKEKSGQIKGQTERTDTDRKRERRKKKLHQKLKEKKRIEKLNSQTGNASAKTTKLEKLETLKKLKQNKNTKIANVDEGGKIKSSKDFFSRLQDTMDSKNRTKPQKKQKLK